MNKLQHFGIVLSNSVDKNGLIENICIGKTFAFLATKKGLFYSETAIEETIQKEDKYDCVIASKTENRKLQTYSSGERKRIFLKYCIEQNSDYLVLDNPLGHLDLNAKIEMAHQLEWVSKTKNLIQIADRRSDLLNFITNKYHIKESDFSLIPLEKKESINDKVGVEKNLVISRNLNSETLIDFNAVSLQYGDKKVLDNLTWRIKKGDFWHLVGPNGSGKSTVLSLINGDNPKAYGQDITLFGRKKGTGESIWDIKKQIGYFNPNMTDLFGRSQTLEQMVVSGFYDSIGLYSKPTDYELKRAQEWLKLADLNQYIKKQFSRLTVGQKRLALIIRAVIKTPKLLILDEPLAGLDDDAVTLMIAFVNTLVAEQKTTVIYVSHQFESRIKPTAVFELTPSETGSTGRIL
jgi:molybdate transport system ATP-binding protein